MAFFALLGFCLREESSLCQSAEIQPQLLQIKRLILIDGSFEPISQYSIEKDRVRYFSTDRYTWEELPYSLIDWAATEQYARRATEEASSRMDEALKEASEAKKDRDARTPLISPELRLPSEGVFLLDVYQGKAGLSRLTQNDADLKKNTGSNILRSIFNPVAGSKQTVELKGLHARIQSHVPAPAIFFPVSSPDVEADRNTAAIEDRFRIVRCEKKKENRIAVFYSIAITGKVKQQAQYIDIAIEPLSQYWAKITPAAPLKKGEYALVELDSKGTMNLSVWDFGVNPAAPMNPVIEMNDSERKEPALIQKPQKSAVPQMQ